MDVCACDLDREINLDHLDQTHFILCKIYQKIDETSIHVDSVDKLSECIL